MDKKTLRQQLIEERLNLPDRLERADLLQRVMRIWLFNRPDTVIGAYWPIKGEFDPLPALHRWKEYVRYSIIDHCVTILPCRVR